VEFWIGLFVVIVIFGALAGGKSFGGTISKGVGCLFQIILGILILYALSLFVLPAN
jgi:hypothetical protein